MLASNITQSHDIEAKLTVISKAIDKDKTDFQGEEINDLIKDLLTNISTESPFENSLDEDSYKALVRKLRAKLKNRIPKKFKIDKEGLESASNQKALEASKLQLQNFLIYEIYKAMNPHRIAGEASKENYEHNVILQGFDYATKYEGGSERERRSYSKEYLEKLSRRHKQFTRKTKQGK